MVQDNSSQPVEVTVICDTGIDYRRVQVKNEDRFRGACVY
jgi:hypothetical protein